MEISKLQHAALAAVAAQHDVELLLLFGSFTAPEKTHSESDVDIAVRFRAPTIELRPLLALQGDLQEIFAPHVLDLADLRRADPLFLKKICDRCQLLVGNERQLAELKLLAFRRYVDHGRYFAMEREYARRTLQHLTGHS